MLFHHLMLVDDGKVEWIWVCVLGWGRSSWLGCPQRADHLSPEQGLSLSIILRRSRSSVFFWCLVFVMVLRFVLVLPYVLVLSFVLVRLLSKLGLEAFGRSGVSMVVGEAFSLITYK